MKVKVNVKTSPKAQEKYYEQAIAEAYAEMEAMFQENKELRVHVGHLRDELNLAQQQSEARRQIICERDKLIQELNDQIAADEEELASAKANAEIQRSFREEMAEEIEALEKELIKSESESSQGMNAMVKFWEEAVNEKNKAEEQAEEYRIALMESDCRVDECEKRMDWLSKEVLEWKATAEGYKNQYEELKAQKEADDKKSEEICTACNERYEEVLAERNHLRERIAKYEKSVTFAKMEEATLTISRLREEIEILIDERDTAVNENTEMMFKINKLRDEWEAEHNLHAVANKRLEALQEEHNELEADYDTLAQTKREYA
jgi:chromosome segregation ATPase